MKRLYSYLIYIFLVFFPVFFIAFVINMNQHFRLTIAYFFSNDLIALIALLPFIFICIKVKRVYIKDGELLIYNLFSNKCVVVNKVNLVSIGRFIPLDPFSYKISYVDDGSKTRTIYFTKNLFIFNMSDAIVDLRS